MFRFLSGIPSRYVFSLRVFIKASIQEFVYVAVFVAQKMA